MAAAARLRVDGLRLQKGVREVAVVIDERVKVQVLRRVLALLVPRLCVLFGVIVQRRLPLLSLGVEQI